jgi:hypothetical protein
LADPTLHPAVTTPRSCPQSDLTPPGAGGERRSLPWAQDGGGRPRPMTRPRATPELPLDWPPSSPRPVVVLPTGCSSAPQMTLTLSCGRSAKSRESALHRDGAALRCARFITNEEEDRTN